MKSQKKSFTWLIIFLVGFPQISETIYTPSLSDLALHFKVSGSQIQHTLSIYFCGFAIGVFLWGILSDYTGRKPAMLTGIALYSIGSLLCLRAPGFEDLLWARFIQALGAAAGSNVSQTILRDTYNDRERVAVFSKISAVLAFSPAIGPLAGSIIASVWDVSMVFGALVLTGIVAFTWSVLRLQETRVQGATTTYNLKAIGRNIVTDKSFWIWGGLIGVINGIIFSYYGEAPFIFIDHLHFSMVAYGCIGFVVALASFCGAWCCKRLSQSRSKQQVLYFGNFAFLTGIGIYLVAVLCLSPFHTLMIAALLLAIFVVMFGITCMLPVCLSNALVRHKGYLGIAGTVLGLYYYTLVGGITWLMSAFHNATLLAFPLFLLLWFVINTGLILVNRE